MKINKIFLGMTILMFLLIIILIMNSKKRCEGLQDEDEEIFKSIKHKHNIVSNLKTNIENYLINKNSQYALIKARENYETLENTYDELVVKFNTLTKPEDYFDSDSVAAAEEYITEYNNAYDKAVKDKEDAEQLKKEAEIMIETYKVNEEFGFIGSLGLLLIYIIIRLILIKIK